MNYSVDLVQTQIKVAEGLTLPELQMTQEKIETNGYAIQCRLTTEDPARGFQVSKRTPYITSGKGLGESKMTNFADVKYCIYASIYFQ